MGTKNNPGRFDCYANAAPDEPMFVLLGRDRHAAGLVQLWALLRHREGEDEEKVAEALACAKAMEDYGVSIGKFEAHQLNVFEAMNLDATEGMTEHPKDYDDVCDCDLCRRRYPG